LFIPSGTPEPIAQRLRAAAKVAAQDTKARDIIQNTGSPVQYLDSPDFEKYVQADAKRMTDVVKKIGKVE
jgi:tripartite-type tricarboxylate transporter receptor subunit TctC